MKNLSSLEEIREEIDHIDEQLLELLNKRMDLVNYVGELKKANKTHIYRPEREKAIIDRLCTLNKGRLNRSAIEAIYLEIFAVSRNIELPEKIAYLGPEGSFTHQAAEARFGAMSDYIPLREISSVFEAVVTERVRFGIIPIENNQQGIVSDSINLLSDHDVSIVAEIPMPIHFAFGSKCESISHIKKIYSKDIAFKQCGNFLEDLYGNKVELIPVESTSKAAQLASEEQESAAICSHIAAKLYNLPILHENIEDSPDNYTRFLIISQHYENEPSGNDKTTILAKLSNSNEPGSLVNLLNKFHKANINLTKIESYPAKQGKNFNYWFLLEFEGHFHDKNVQPILTGSPHEIKWLGSYPKLC